MRIAIIDLGTNSIRFDVHDVRARGQAHLVHREKLMVRLGEDVFLTGKLERRAMRRTLQAFLHFRDVAKELRTQRIVAFATSAMREASDSTEFLKKIRKQTGIDVRVISGEEEAKLIAQGILKREKSARGSIGLIDIGGGSTEVSVCRDGKVVKGDSFPLGVARLQQIFLKASPPENGEKSVRKLRQHIRNLLQDKIHQGRWPSVNRLIGSSGTMRTLSRMSKRQTGSKFIERDWLKSLIHQMSRLTVSQISRLEGMEPKRADLILAGTIVLDEVMRALGASRSSATDYSLRDGILDHELHWLEPHRVNHARDLSEFVEKAERFGVERARSRWLVELAGMVFQKFQKLHRLENQWGTYLSVAVIFRDTGRAVSPVGHERHSHYIVKHAELPFGESWETDFVAQLCLQHEDDQRSNTEFLIGRPLTFSRAFEKLLALIRIIDALDSTYPRKVIPVRVRIQPRRVHVKLSQSPSTELAVLKLHRKKELFEEVFKKMLLIDNELNK